MTAATRLPAPAPVAAAALGAAACIGALAAREPLLATAAALFGFAFAAAVTRPDLTTLLAILLLYSNIPAVAVKVHGAPLALAALAPLLPAVALLHHLLRRERVTVDRPLALVGLFLLVQVASTLRSTEPELAWENVKTFLIEGVVLYFLVVNVVRTKQLLRAAIWTIVLTAGALGALSVFQEVTGTYAKPYGGFAQVPREFFTGHAASARMSGPIGDPNYYAQILLIAIPLGLLVLWRERSPALRLTGIGATVLAAAGVILTFSRGAGLAFAIVLGLMTVLRYVRARHLVVVVVGVVVGLTAVPAYKERVSTLTTVTGAATAAGEGEADMSLRSRTTEMLAAALVFADHPVVGVGPGVFPSYYQAYANRVGIEVRETVTHGARRGEEARRESHNMLLSVAADLGLAGVLTFVAVIGASMVELVRARRVSLARDPELADAATGFLLAIVGFVTTGLFLTLAFERYFWLLLALAGACAAIARRAAEADDGHAGAGGAVRAPAATPRCAAKNAATLSS